MLAARYGHDAICTALLDGGAEINAKDNVSIFRGRVDVCVCVAMQSPPVNGAGGVNGNGDGVRVRCLNGCQGNGGGDEWG